MWGKHQQKMCRLKSITHIVLNEFLGFQGNILITYLGFRIFLQPRLAIKKMTPTPENSKTHAKIHVLCNGPLLLFFSGKITHTRTQLNQRTGPNV